MKKIVFITYILCVLCANQIFAQTTDDEFITNYKSVIDNIFSGISPEKVTTGILIERSLSLVNLDAFDASINSESCNNQIWFNIYRQLFFGCLNFETFNVNQELLNANFYEIPEANDIQIGMLLYDYNKFNDNAILDGNIIFDTINNKVTDVSRVYESPFDKVTCFAVSPLKNEAYIGTVVYNINQDLFFSNKVSNFDELYIDFGDGNGYVEVTLGSNITINYNEIGSISIKVKGINNGNTYFSNCNINIIEDPLSNSLLKSDSYSSSPNYGPVEYDKNGIKAEYGIFYRCNNTDNKIRKPYIIVSGFDPNDMNRIKDINKKINLYRVANKDGYLDNLRENGYDIIIYRSKQSTKSIISNANNLVEFIKKINSEKTSDNELIIAGASMGGLIVRYALTYMEYYGIDHKTKLFISIDSPQNGANVPLGIQHMIQYLSLDLGIFNEVFMNLKKAKEKGLDSDAAKEMLLYHYSKTQNGTANPSIKRETFITNLNAIGNFPKKCRNIAISLGSGTAQSQGFISGQLLLKKNPTVMPGDVLIPGSKIHWDFAVSAVPNHVEKAIYTENVNIQVCTKVAVPTITPPFFIKFKTRCMPLSPFFPQRNIVVNNTNPIDNAPGSIQGLHNTKSFMGDFIFLRDFLSFAGEIDYDPNPDCFIPSYSSLGLNSVTPHTNIKNYFNSNPNVLRINNNEYINRGDDNISLFDIMYIEDDNKNHIYDENYEGVFSPNMISFMKNNSSPEDLYIENNSVEFNKKKTFESRNTIKVGFSVDNKTFNNGNVLVKSGGKLTLYAKKSVSLLPGFIAEKSSVVSIIPKTNEYCNAGTVVTKSLIIEEQGLLKSELVSEVKENEVNPEMYDIVEEYSKPILIYPNPTTNNVFISSNKEFNELFLYNLDGVLILQKTFSRSTEIDFIEKPSGIYICKIHQEDGSVITEKIIKQ